jgi:hypothetical protein
LLPFAAIVHFHAVLAKHGDVVIHRGVTVPIEIYFIEELLVLYPDFKNFLIFPVPGVTR